MTPGRPETSDTTLHGTCACGKIRYAIDGQLQRPITYCHCWRCRKHSGSSFGTTAMIGADQLRVLQGGELLSYWESSPGIRRHFASCCGSPVYKAEEGSDTLGFRLGTLDDDPHQQVEQHYMVNSKAPWVTISDDLTQATGDDGLFGKYD